MRNQPSYLVRDAAFDAIAAASTASIDCESRNHSVDQSKAASDAMKRGSDIGVDCRYSMLGFSAKISATPTPRGSNRTRAARRRIGTSQPARNKPRKEWFPRGRCATRNRGRRTGSSGRAGAEAIRFRVVRGPAFGNRECGGRCLGGLRRHRNRGHSRGRGTTRRRSTLMEVRRAMTPNRAPTRLACFCGIGDRRPGACATRTT